MDKKKEALHALGWTDELIEHFLADKFPEIEKVENPMSCRVYETNNMSITYDVSTNTFMQLKI